jgi:hypothetical protein
MVNCPKTERLKNFLARMVLYELRKRKPGFPCKTHAESGSQMMDCVARLLGDLLMEVSDDC